MDPPNAKEEESLLHEGGAEYCKHCARRKTSRAQLCHLIGLYSLISILICLIVFLRPGQVQNLYSPASSVVAYHDVLFYDNIRHMSPYQGTPNDEKDELWETLYNGKASRRFRLLLSSLPGTSGTLITTDEASKMPNRTMPVPGFDGQSIIVLEVFHQLHCLNTLRKSLYPSRFPSYAVLSSNGTLNKEVLTHYEHCIDRVRQGIQCASNTGSVYYRWREDLQIWAPEMEDVHECRNFETILQWAVSRQFTPWRGWDEQKPAQKES